MLLIRPHPLQLFGGMLQHCVAVKLQKCFVDSETIGMRARR